VTRPLPLPLPLPETVSVPPAGGPAGDATAGTPGTADAGLAARVPTGRRDGWSALPGSAPSPARSGSTGGPAAGVAPPPVDRLRTVAGSVLWPLAVLALAQVALRSALGPARDLDILWRGARRLLAGDALYDPDLAFIYPPLGGWVLAPLGAMPFRVACVVLTVVSLASLVAAVVLLLRLVGVPARSPLTAGALGLLAVSRPVDGLLGQGNIDVLLLLAEALVIVWLVRRRDVAAGVLLGVVCAVKPTLAPLLLGALMLGRVRTTVVAAGTAAALTVAGFLLVPDGTTFLTDVLPMLADGNRPVLQQYDKSLRGAAAQLGLPAAVGLVLRAVALALAVWVAWRRRHGRLAPLEVMPVLLLGGMLASSFSWANYSLYLVPLLVAVVVPGGLVRTWPAWAGVFAFWTADEWPRLPQGETVEAVVGLRPLWGWSLLLGTCAWVALRSGSRLGEHDTPSDQPAPPAVRTQEPSAP